MAANEATPEGQKRWFKVYIEMVGGFRFISEVSLSEEQADDLVDRLRKEGIGGAYRVEE